MPLLRLARTPPLTITRDSTVMDAVKLMVDHKVGAVSVTEGAKLIGIFTERDVMKKIVFTGMDPSATKISDVMTTEITRATSDMSVSEAIKLLSEHRIRHLPITTPEGEIKGMISLRFLMHDRLEDLMTELSSVTSYLGADGPGG